MLDFGKSCILIDMEPIPDIATGVNRKTIAYSVFAVLALAVAGYWYWTYTQKIAAPQTAEEAVQQIEEVSAALEQAAEIPTAPPSANPIKNIAPAENPIEKTNPFDYEYQNPFK